MNADKIVIGLTGMPGSGKSLVVVETAQELGYAVVVMGDVIREETQKRGLELNPTNVGKVMLELRAAGGDNVIAEKCISKIEQKDDVRVIVEGIRSLHEANVFKTHFAKFTLMAVHSSPETRFKRLYSRGRSDDPNCWELFYERDMRELGVGIGNAIAMAEFMVINEESKDAAKEKVKETMKRVEMKWTK
jgi:dephospho-CoA kinase